MNRRIGSICSVALALGMASLCSAVPAAGQSGNGLYEPFPEAAVKKRAERYVKQLSERTADMGRRYSDPELASGVFVGSGASGSALSVGRGGAATARSGPGDAADVPLPLELLLLALAFGAPAFVLLRGDRPRAA